jgi:hypothetical protein
MSKRNLKGINKRNWLAFYNTLQPVTINDVDEIHEQDVLGTTEIFLDFEDLTVYANGRITGTFAAKCNVDESRLRSGCYHRIV